MNFTYQCSPSPFRSGEVGAKHGTRGRGRHTCRPRFEALEHRESTASISLVFGMIVIQADSFGNNSATVSAQGSNYVVTLTNSVTRQTQTVSFAQSRVKSVEYIATSPGSDLFVNQTRLNTLALGGGAGDVYTPGGGLNYIQGFRVR